MTDVAKKCFIAMPFGQEYADVLEFAVRPAIADSGLEQVDANDLATGGLLWAALREAIKTSDLIIADTTLRNHNVFYELGMAQALGKPTILITKNIQDVPFDLLHIRVLRYNTDLRSLHQLRRDLLRELRRITNDLERQGEDSVTAKVEEDEPLGTTLKRADELQSDGEYTHAVQLLLAAVARQRAAGDGSGLATALNALSTNYQAQGQFDLALSSLQEAFTLVRQLDLPREQAIVAANLANVLAATGDLRQAGLFYHETLELARKIGDSRLEASVMANLGHMQSQTREFAAAEETYSQALVLFRRLEDHLNVARTDANLAALLQQQGRLHEAESRLHEALEIFRALGDRPSQAAVWHNVASLQLSLGHFEEAASLLWRSLEIKNELGDVPGAAASLSVLAHVESAKGNFADALQLYERAAALQEQMGDRYGLFHTLYSIGKLTAGLGDETASRAFLERALSIGEAVDAPEIPEIRERLSSIRDSKQFVG